MRKFLYILTLMLLLGCKSKKSSRTEHREEHRSERREVKDSITEQQRGEVHTFDLRQAHSYELTLEGDSLEVKREKRIEKNDKGEQAYIEVLKVKGGKAVIKMKQEARQEAHAVETVEAHQQMRQVREAKEERMEAATIQREEQRVGRGLVWWISGLALVLVLWFVYKIVRRWVK